MEHKQVVRILPEATTAVLFIHGIVGTPNHFNDFVSLVPQSVSVYNILLDGHGKGVNDFSKTSMKKWESQVASVVSELSEKHDKIFVVAHSLGTLFAIEQAVNSPKICRLFLLSVPLKLALKPRMAANSLKVYFDRISPNDAQALAAKNCYGIAKDKNPFRYLGWTPRFLELFAKIRQSRKTLHLLNTDCWVYQSLKDEMVSKSSVKFLKQNSCISVKELENSGHFYYPNEDSLYLKTEFLRFINTH